MSFLTTYAEMQGVNCAKFNHDSELIHQEVV